MAKKRRRNQGRSAFPEAESRPVMPEQNDRIHADQRSRGIFGFFRDIGVRETIESIVIAIVLALMFRAYEAEAFIIPTGSMAPSLQGQHMDLECEQCNFRYRAGASSESSVAMKRVMVVSTCCPICQYQTRMRRAAEPDHNSNNGDRILVNKFINDFQDPERYDVIVFKNPLNGKQNYIKRLIGLPGDNILIENGDIYLMHDQGNDVYEKEITRKPPLKLRHVLQTVDDTHHIGSALKNVGWPSRWQSFDGKGSWLTQDSGEHPEFSAKSSEKDNWLRYRHFQPLKKVDWPTINNGDLPSRFDGQLPLGRLIGDQYAYNGQIYSGQFDSGEDNFGVHWVGDLGVDFDARIGSATGTLMLDIVEGGAHFICSIDVATGKATLQCNDKDVDSKVTFTDASGGAVAAPTAQTNLRGIGNYHIVYVNADDRLNLWINNKLVEFDTSEYTRIGTAIPTYSVTKVALDDAEGGPSKVALVGDPGDAEPVRIGSDGLDISVSRIKVVRDIYYTSVVGPTGNIRNETGADVSDIMMYHQNPDMWKDAASFFKMKKNQKEPMFRLEKKSDSAKDQFLPMGDNSPESQDGRIWDGPKYFERDLLIGRAMLIYWPHTLNKPIPYFPNFGRMGFIR